MLADNRSALAAAARHRAEDTRARARDALQRLDRAGAPVTFTAVATAAQVSRSLLYRDPALRAEIDQLRDRTPLGSIRPPAAERTTDASLQQRLDTGVGQLVVQRGSADRGRRRPSGPVGGGIGSAERPRDV